ncbi:MAG: hypothetical protein WA631_02695 [Nitrososphaeraceae archaeon]
MFVAERFILNLVKRYGEHPVFDRGGTWYQAQACKFLNKTPSSFCFEKSIIEREGTIYQR